MRRLAPILVLALVFPQLHAQSVISARSGLINYSEGDVLINGQPLQRKFGAYTTLQEGSDLVTRNGRAEILLTPNAYLRLGGDSAVRMISGDLGDTKVELLGGSAMLDSSAAPGKTPITLTVRDTVVRLTAPGTFRIDSDPAQLRVFEGEAEVEHTASAAGKIVKVDSSQMLPLEGAPIVKRFTQGSDNLLDLWSDERHAMIASNLDDAKRIGDPLTDPDPPYSPLSGYLPLVGPPYGPVVTAGAGGYSSVGYGSYPYGGIYPSYSPYGLYPTPGLYTTMYAPLYMPVPAVHSLGISRSTPGLMPSGLGGLSAYRPTYGGTISSPAPVRSLGARPVAPPHAVVHATGRR